MEPETKVIDIMESVYERNELFAAKLAEKFSKKHIFSVNVMGAPGVGKTSSLEKIIRGLNAPACVIEGDIESDIDTRKLNAIGIRTAQINTNGACHLDSPFVSEIFEKELADFSGGYLFIENIGNLICPAEFMIGEHIKLLISTVTEGSDKPYKYPLAFEKADVILLNKSDLLAYLDFDLDFFMNGVRKLNPTAPVFQVSAKTGEGFGEAITWLQNRAKPILTTE